MKKSRGIIYGVLVALLLVMGAWWVYFLTLETDAHAEFERQKLVNDRLHAVFLIQSNPAIRDNPEGTLGKSFPQLVFTKTPKGVEVQVDPVMLKATRDKARSTRNMFLYEGLFFMCLLLAGSTILVLSWRSETRFVQARELFLAGATHEFKTPLASLRLYTQTLSRTGLKEMDKTRIQGRMVEDIQRLENLVNEILAMSADDTFTPGPKVKLDLVAASQGVIDNLAGVVQDNNATITLHHEGKFFAQGQEVAFTLALRNLLVNAIRHNENPVNIQVRFSRRDQWTQLIVQDDGQGIARRLHEKVFDCFYSGNNDGTPTSGAGVGLYLVRRNITNMGGQIKIVSDEKQGCTFQILLPTPRGENK
jgi:two-component system, OmpR family, phosphate regulon sensor histidine kinase PhoR